MVTNADIEPAETKQDRAEGIARTAIAGDQRGAVRRIILYVLTFGFLVAGWPLGAVLCLALLVSTDQLV
jgi:hypothetical protein